MRKIIYLLSMLIVWIWFASGCALSSDEEGLQKNTEESTAESGTINVEESTDESTKESIVESTAEKVAPQFIKVSFENNYLEKMQIVDLSKVISREDFDTFLGVIGDTLYYIYYKPAGLIIYSVDCIEEGAKPQVVYENDEGHIWYYQEIIEGKIYVAGCDINDGCFSFWIHEINVDGSAKEIYPRTEARKAPIIYALPEYLIVNFWTGENCVMEAITLGNPEEKLSITETQLALDDDGNMVGDFILYGGALEPDGFYYEVVTLNHEFLDAEGVTTMFYYDFGAEEAEVVMQSENKSLFLTGGANYLVRCLYSYDFPLNVSGEFYLKEENEWGRCWIPELRTAYDLVWMEKTEDNYAVGYNGKDILLLDIEQMQKAIYTITPEEGLRCSDVWLIDGEIGFVLYNKKRIELYRLAIS